MASSQDEKSRVTCKFVVSFKVSERLERKAALSSMIQSVVVDSECVMMWCVVFRGIISMEKGAS